MNLGKTKVMIFNTSMQWLSWSTLEFTHRGELVEHVRSHVYFGGHFQISSFFYESITAKASLIRRYVAMDSSERMCSQV